MTWFFSLSVLEHVLARDRADVYKDMYRILRPGGHIVHTIDRPQEAAGLGEFDAIKSAGFLLPPEPDLSIRVRHAEGEATLFEPTCIVFRTYYGKKRKDMWTKLRSIDGYTPTILVVAEKPMLNESIDGDRQ